MNNENLRRKIPWRRGIRILGLTLSALLCVGLTICYGVRPDALAALTIVPVWTWLVPGVALALMGVRPGGRREVLAVLAAWLVFLLCFAEEPWSLLRHMNPPSDPPRGRQVLRIVTLNCAGATRGRPGR